LEHRRKELETLSSGIESSGGQFWKRLRFTKHCNARRRRRRRRRRKIRRRRIRRSRRRRRRRKRRDHKQSVDKQNTEIESPALSECEGKGYEIC